MPTKKLLIHGFGDLGFRVVKLLIRAEGEEIFQLALGVRNVEKTRRTVNLLRLSFLQANDKPMQKIEIVQLNVQDENESGRALREWNPDVVFNSASMQSWRVITQLPEKVFQELDEAQFGPWLPMHLVPLYWLMRAVRASGARPIVVNAAFPDACNAVLARIGLGPDLGIGNIANIIPATRLSVALHLDVPVQEVEVRAYAHHFVSHMVPRTGDVGGARFAAEAYVRGERVPVDFEKDIFPHLASTFKRMGGILGQELTAASAYSVLHKLAFNLEGVVHSPGPNGEIGGYAIRLKDGRPQIESHSVFSIEDLRAINMDGSRFDGIDAIDGDGTVHFGAAQMSIMQRMIGYHRLIMRPGEMEECARELGEKYKAFAQSHGSSA